MTVALSEQLTRRTGEDRGKRQLLILIPMKRYQERQGIPCSSHDRRLTDCSQRSQDRPPGESCGIRAITAGSPSAYCLRWMHCYFALSEHQGISIAPWNLIATLRPTQDAFSILQHQYCQMGSNSGEYLGNTNRKGEETHPALRGPRR